MSDPQVGEIVRTLVARREEKRVFGKASALHEKYSTKTELAQCGCIMELL